jgi:hypothetical protein
MPMTQTRCKKGCCTRTFLPLELSFARTLHTFQGLSAGECGNDNYKSAVTTIICDPDIKVVESKSTGFFYTMISRARSLGDENGLNSSIYFTGDNFTKDRIQNLTCKKNTNTTFVNIVKRDEWVAYLAKHTMDPSQFDPNKQKRILAWASTTKISYDQLYNRTKQYMISKKNL